MPTRLKAQAVGQTLLEVGRRGKYLLLHFPKASLIIHLGMSGNLKVLPVTQAPTAYDHVDLVFTDNLVLRYSDPRRFGSMHWARQWHKHPLICKLGPEPFAEHFDANYLKELGKNRTAPVKNFIMNARVVAGIGNIYANEALFRAGIHPLRQAKRISRKRYGALIVAMKNVLQEATAAGGTTLKDFFGNEGKAGYFRTALKIYGRGGLPCLRCHAMLKETRLGNRSTVYCSSCQT